MGQIKADAILERIRQVVELGLGVDRAINQGTFLGDLPDGLSADADRMRGVTGARAEAKIKSLAKNAASPVGPSNLMFYDIMIEVRVIRDILPVAFVDDDTRDAVKALAATDSDRVAQAFEFPGNMAGTTAYAQAVGATYPTGFTGGEQFDFSVDSVPVSVIFEAADQSAAECAARISTAMAAAGVGDGIGVVGGQLVIVSPTTGATSELTFSLSGETAALGFTPGTTTGATCDLASGLLTYTGASFATVGEIDGGAQTLETIHNFVGIAIARPS